MESIFPFFLQMEKRERRRLVLDRRGGAPQQLTNVKEEIDDYQWSPDGKRILLEMSEGEDADAANIKETPKAPKPIVLDRYILNTTWMDTSPRRHGRICSYSKLIRRSS